AVRSDEQHNLAARPLLEGEVHVGPRLVAQVGAANVANNADDFGLALPELHHAADGPFVGKESALDRVADDDHWSSVRRVARVEETSRLQRYLQRAEVAA